MTGASGARTNSNTVKRSAYFCMCGTGLFMIVSKLLSFVLYDVYYKAAAENFDRTEIVLTNIIRALFGANTGVSIAAARSVLGSGIPDSFFAMFTTLVTLVIPAYVFSKLSGRGISDGFPVKGKLSPDFLSLLFAAQLFMTGAAVIASFFYDFIMPDSSSFISSGTAAAYTGEADGYTLLISALETAVFVPIAEEYVFRGAVFGALRKYGTNFAVIASAFVFGVMHFSASQSMYAFAFGIISAMLVVYTGNIKTSVLFHAFNNFYITLSDYLSAADVSSYYIFTDMFYILCAVLGIFGIMKLFSKGGFAAKYSDLAQISDERNGLCGTCAGVGQIFTVPVIMFLVLYASRVFALG